MKKENVVYRCNGVLFRHKRKGILSFAVTWMNLESTTLSEISQIEEDKYCTISLIVDSKNVQTQKQRTGWLLPGQRVWRVGDIGKSGQKL